MLTNKIVQNIFILLLVVGAVLCIYTPDNLLLKWGTNFTPQIMVAYLLLGVGFLMASQQRLMFTSLACSAMLCLFLKDASGEVLKYPAATQQPSVSVAHFNLANSESDFIAQIDAMLNTDADLLSIQELTIDWEVPLMQALSPAYPYFKSIPDLGINGVAVYSKHPFQTIDTFHYENTPNIVGSIAFEDNLFYFIGSHTMPAFTEQAYLSRKLHLERVAQECKMINEPLMTFGEYHEVPWSEEIRHFRMLAELNDSRRNFTPTHPHGALTFFDLPIDHIFFTDHFQCTSFNTISGETSDHLGIQAVFEFVDPTLDILSEARKQYYVREASFEF